MAIQRWLADLAPICSYRRSPVLALSRRPLPTFCSSALCLAAPTPSYGLIRLLVTSSIIPVPVCSQLPALGAIGPQISSNGSQFSCVPGSQGISRFSRFVRCQSFPFQSCRGLQPPGDGRQPRVPVHLVDLVGRRRAAHSAQAHRHRLRTTRLSGLNATTLCLPLDPLTD